MITHGMTNTPTHNSYKSMINRCLSKNNIGYARYGGRGITVCKRWLDFRNFLNDMGLRPPEKTLERINNRLGYSKKNCRWATRAEQNRNTRTNRNLRYKGRSMCLTDWAIELGVNRTTLQQRLLKYNWSIEKALSTPSRNWVRKPSHK